MADYRNLDVWQQGRTIVTTAYRFTEMLPEAEKTGLIQQIKTSAIAIPACIADGAGRGNDVQFLRLIQDALGALSSLDTLVMLAADLEYVEEFHTHDLEKRTRELSLKLKALAGKLESDAFGVRKRQFDSPRPPRDGDSGEGGGDDRPRRSYRDEGRDERPPFRRDDSGGDRGRPPFRRDDSDRPPYRRDDSGGGDRPPYRGGGGDRPPFRGGGDRPPYRGGGGDRPPYRGGGGDRPPYRGGGSDRPPRRDDGPPRGGGGGSYGGPRGGGGGGSRPPRRKF